MKTSEGVCVHFLLKSLNTAPQVAQLWCCPLQIEKLLSFRILFLPKREKEPSIEFWNMFWKNYLAKYILKERKNECFVLNILCPSWGNLRNRFITERHESQWVMDQNRNLIQIDKLNHLEKRNVTLYDWEEWDTNTNRDAHGFKL